MNQSEPIFVQTESRPASLGSHLANAFNQWKSASLPAQTGQQAPDWFLRDVMHNKEQSNNIFLGKVIALVFCSTWCGPCQWEITSWKELHTQYFTSGLRIVGVFLDFRESIPPFIYSNQLQSYYRCCAATEKIKWDYNVNPTGRIPLLALINRKGILNGTWLGYHPKDAYEAAIKPLL